MSSSSLCFSLSSFLLRRFLSHASFFLWRLLTHFTRQKWHFAVVLFVCCVYNLHSARKYIESVINPCAQSHHVRHPYNLFEMSIHTTHIRYIYVCDKLTYAIYPHHRITHMSQTKIKIKVYRTDLFVRARAHPKQPNMFWYVLVCVRVRCAHVEALQKICFPSIDQFVLFYFISFHFSARLFYTRVSAAVGAAADAAQLGLRKANK